jgi:hypothetical protein
MPSGRPRFASSGLQDWAQVGDPAVVAQHQLGELAAVADVLVLEGERAAAYRRTEHRFHDLVVDRGQLGARARKKFATPPNPWSMLRARDGRGVNGGARRSCDRSARRARRRPRPPTACPRGAA